MLCIGKPTHIPGKKGQIYLNGCPARLFQPGDQVIILSLGHYSGGEAPTEQRLVFVDKANSIITPS
jgi:aspartate 1-decarboxylase